MRNIKVNVSKIAETVMKELDDFQLIAAEAVQRAVKKTAEETVEEIKKTAPIRTGKYSESWDAGYEGQKNGKYYMTVYSNMPHLPHLLENRHLTRNGDRTREFPHIGPASEKAKNRMVEHLKEELQ